MRVEKTLAEATTKFVDVLHHKNSGIKISAIANYEDENFTFEITIPKNLSIDDVLETCHKKCIKVEDEYDLFCPEKPGPLGQVRVGLLRRSQTGKAKILITAAANLHRDPEHYRNRII